MGLLRKRSAQPETPPPTIRDSLETLIQTSARPSLFAHSEFVKKVECVRCGAPKRLPSKTAYLYCDHCGALIDYDFRLANSGTNAGITNTVFHQLVTPLQTELARARAIGDADRYRELMRGIYAEWMRQCPEAVSPRAKTDEDFRDRMAGYCAESTARKDLDPALAPLDRSLNAGNCGDELKTLPGATAVVCESCGRKLDIAGGEVPCQTCGARLSFPVGVSGIECPYCHSATHRI